MSSIDSQRKLAHQHDLEVDMLQNVKSLLLKAKQELNNDLTKLAIRNLPMMAPSQDQMEQPSTSKSEQDVQYEYYPQQDEVNLSQSTVDSSDEQQQQQQQQQKHEPGEGDGANMHLLEPLDLDV